MTRSSQIKTNGTVCKIAKNKVYRKLTNGTRTKQHEALTQAYGGLFPNATRVHSILAPAPAKAVLDLGMRHPYAFYSFINLFQAVVLVHGMFFSSINHV